MTAAKQISEEELWAQVSEAQRGVLEANHFDVEEFMALRQAYLSGELSASKNRLGGEVEVPADEDVRELPGRDSAEGRAFIALGEAAISRGEVGIVVLNGGMATRFGGVVKGCVEVFDGLSFLALKARDIGRYGSAARMLLMNSFATAEKTAQHLRAHDNFGLNTDQIIHFNQSVSLRMAPEGELFRRDEAQNVSLYAPGHGDLQTAIRREALAEFRRSGGKYLMMSNVDNILATLDPLVVGMHVDASSRGVQMSVEAVQKKPGQVGGFVARVDGMPQIVEHFRLPDASLKDALQLLNTNTFLFDADALEEQAELTWFVVEKTVDGRSAIQFERLAGELSAVLKTAILKVPSTGDDSRFEPVKRREDLAQNRDRLKSLMAGRGII
ncbi:UTP--glucose-1-phosphate uridylyltransferase [Bradymonas sediminis]|uniref:Uncharacterized protein n=1 Tax=Bradymonas sediminis TaxID=1548548 RepID=A0A2Z4FN22_9DELT|nr:UTP--glucose-1-phosphate uridylyltransferase [Bradymonas sediminis]AWV90166.1 hypothetical protein DN745_12815 [Bradymonas sediminis]TDP75867.1 UTP--glucose-1-phosphate uridylyltransferase [Bradymonas sediminis]